MLNLKKMWQDSKDRHAEQKAELEGIKKLRESFTPQGCPPDSFVSLQHLEKVYPNGFHAVYDLNLEIKKHEFIVLVGPSGCGKSTTLRMVAGLEDISSGALYINGQLSNNLMPKDRDIAMVFQSYALYPHMSVYDNMAYSLKIHHLHKNEIDARVHEAAKILQIENYLDNKPKELSGGQRQRVALGRAMVRKAKVFLMDEPLSNLDAKLRVQMRAEIINLHQQIGATTIYVTHDQSEAMTMATRILIMNRGYVQQIGTPFEVYNNPANLFVAGFIGSPAMNFYDVKVNGDILEFPRGEKILMPDEVMKAHSFMGHDRVVFGIRPDDIHYGDGEHARKYPSAVFTGPIAIAELLGSDYYLHTKFSGQPLISKVEARKHISNGDTVPLCFNLAKAHFFDKETGAAI